MIDPTTIKVGDILTFKKSHPCGCYDWKVLRIGIDYKLECVKCHRIITILRIEALKKIKEIREKTN